MTATIEATTPDVAGRSLDSAAKDIEGTTLGTDDASLLGIRVGVKTSQTFKIRGFFVSDRKLTQDEVQTRAQQSINSFLQVSHPMFAVSEVGVRGFKVNPSPNPAFRPRVRRNGRILSETELVRRLKL